MKIRIIGAAVAALGALTLTACGATPATTATSSTTASAPAPAPDPPSSSAAPTTNANPAAQFGQNKVYKDGLTVSVSAPEPYQPSSMALVPPDTVSFETSITVTNGTSANFDPSMIQVSAQGGGGAGQEIFDSPRINGSPDTALLPGGSVSYKVAFAVPATTDIVVQVQPGFDYEAVLFTATGS